MEGAAHTRHKLCNSYTDGGRVVFKMGLSPWRRAHSSYKSATVTRMEGGPFSKLVSRFSAAHIRLKSFQQLQGWRAGRFPNWVLAKAPRTFVLKVPNGYRDGGRLLFKMRLSPSRLKGFQQLQGWRAGGFQNWALSLAPRTFVLNVSNSYRDGGRFLFKMRLSQ